MKEQKTARTHILFTTLESHAPCLRCATVQDDALSVVWAFREDSASKETRKGASVGLLIPTATERNEKWIGRRPFVGGIVAVGSQRNYVGTTSTPVTP